MLSSQVEKIDVPRRFEEARTYRSIGATRGGFCFFECECGDLVAEEDTLAVLRGFLGAEIEHILAPQDGIVIVFLLEGNQAAGTGDKIADPAH